LFAVSAVSSGPSRLPRRWRGRRVAFDSFHVATIDPATMSMTVKECLWNANRRRQR
jgi:hypothetical protein